MNDIQTSYLLLIVLFPLVGAIINGLFGRRLSHFTAAFVGCGAIFISFVFAAATAWQVFAGRSDEIRLVQTVYNWMAVKGLSVDVTFLLDPLSTVMVVIVTGTSFLIHVYSVGYMHGDAGFARYFAYLNLFVFSMLVLILGSSLPLMFVGWEGVGLCSYLLIGFWFEDPEKASAGKKAFVVNRIGDLGFLIGMFALFGAVGDLSFDALKNAADGGAFTAGLATFACLALFVGATGKSAQIPLYVWLPDAMAGPTPVSALIHAATMVTAGVYMIARMSFLFALSPTASAVVTLVGGITALFAASIGIAQTDIKKVLAYSTVSQLGYMMIGVGSGAYFAGIFHLMTHAFFKACLFLGAGAVIHALSGEQDIRQMGGLKKKLPFTYWTFLASTIAIAGFPPCAGFFSKDEILWKVVSTASKADWAASWVHAAAYAMGIAGAAITSFYMFRLVFMTFHGTQRSNIHVHHETFVMSAPLVVLAFFAVTAGFVNPSLLGVEGLKEFLEPVLGRAQETAVALTALSHNHGAEWAFAGLSVAVAAVGLFIAWALYLKQTGVPARIVARIPAFHRMVLNKYYVDEIYEVLVVRPIHVLSIVLWKVADIVLVDKVMVSGPPALLRGLGVVGRALQSGNLMAYAFWIFIGFTALIVYAAVRVGLI